MKQKTGQNEITKVVIIGGGTAGWLTACHLGKKLVSDHSPVQVLLIESPNIPTIGVGEGTVPAFRNSLKYLGISESDFIKTCDVTLKQSVKFINWVYGDDHYHHIFDYPARPDHTRPDIDLTPYYLLGHAGDIPYVDAVSVQGQIIDKGRAPKTISDTEYNGKASYAYHLDAAKFAAFLTRHATQKLGVKHILAEVQDIHLDSAGYITGVKTDKIGNIDGDFFIDCTGFQSRILGQKLGVPFINKNDVLFVDTALAMQAPYGNNKAVPSSTLATAKDAGWIWDIGLMERRGTGYVFSSRYTDDITAEATLRDYLRPSIGDQVDDIACRRIPMQVGYREKFWVKNCAAIGLSQGFVEPLEATGILVFDATARMLAEQFPATLNAVPALAKQFNKRVQATWDSVIDFIKLHYCISRRDDTDFWRDNQKPETITDSLRDKLEIWKYQPPSPYDFTSKLDIFSIENYQYVLYGMQFKTNMQALQNRYPENELAKQQFITIQKVAEQVSDGLPMHRDLIKKVQQYGFQKI